MKLFILIVIVLLSSCVKTIHREENPALQAQKPAPLILGGKHYEGRVGDRVLIRDDYWDFTDKPRKCFVEDASSLLYVRFDIDPLDPNKMNGLENVELLTNIKSLLINGRNLDGIDFSILSALRTLENLIIRVENLNRVDLSPLSALNTLKYLTIEGEKLDRVDFSHLSALSSLEYLFIKGEHLESVNLSFISALCNLEDLIIEGNISRPLDLTSLEKLTYIRITNSALENFEGLGAPNVKKIESEMKTFDSLVPLSNLTELEFLYIMAPRSKLVTIGNIKNVPKLKTLFLETSGTIDLTGIEQMTGLEDLRLGMKATPINAKGISNLRNLELLVMSIIEDENPSIEYLRGLPKLRSVYIESETSIWNDETKEPYQILDVSPLGKSPKLEKIDLRGFLIRNVSALNHLENLTYNAIILHESKLLDETEAKRSTKWLIFDVSILRDG